MNRAQKGQRGFSLIEMITAVVLIAIIAGVIAPVINMAIRSYADTEARVELTAKGRFVIERIARELRHAVPNSVTVINDGSVSEGIEFISARAGGRYIDSADNYGSAFAVPARRFEKNKNRTRLYLVAPGLGFQPNDRLVIGNTSTAELISGATVVPLTGIVATALTPDGTTDGLIASFANHSFPNDSPSRHVQIADHTHEVGRSGNRLYWRRTDDLTEYNLAADWSTDDPLLMDGVESLNFTYVAGTPQSTGILRIELGLSSGKEAIELYHEIQVRNTP